MKKIFVALIIIAVAVALYRFGLADYLSLDALKAQQAEFAGFYARNPVLVIAAFFLIYVISTALSLPGAAVLTLAGGALFGVVEGTIIVSFASTIGATLAFLGSRFLLRDWVQAKFGDKLRSINEGVERDGAFYLLSLRLVWVFPFFAVNLLMGLTPIRAWTYYWVSQLGMLLGTIVYVNAGTQLARIERLSDIASPGLLASFVALGMLPWLGKWIMAAIVRRRVYARWQRPKRFDRNMVVIGAGAARLPNTASIALHGVSADRLVIALDLDGIAISAGSACASGKVGPSHVLSAMGLAPELSSGAVRISLGHATTDADIDAFLAAFARHGVRPTAASRNKTKFTADAASPARARSTASAGER